MSDSGTTLDKELLDNISTIVSEYLNKNIDAEAMQSDLFDIFPEEMTVEEKSQAVSQAQVRCVSCYQPGYLPDNDPWFMASTGNVRDMAMNEVQDYAEAYDGDENLGEWDEVLEQLRNASDDAFAKNVTIDMPNGYRISIELASCLDSLHMNGVDLDFDEDTNPNPQV